MKLTIKIDDPKFKIGQQVRIPDDVGGSQLYGKITDRVFQDAMIDEKGNVSFGRWTYEVDGDYSLPQLPSSDWYEEAVLSAWESGKVSVVLDWLAYEAWYTKETHMPLFFEPEELCWRMKDDVDYFGKGDVRYYVHNDNHVAWVPARFVTDLEE